MKALGIINLVLAAVFTFCYFYQFIYLFVAYLGKGKKAPDAPPKRLAVLIAARNESKVIHNLIDSLNSQDYPRDFYKVFLVADNCTDETPLLAALQGSKQNRFTLAFFLIENGADIHMVQQGADSALQNALLVYDHDSEETIADGFLLFQYLMEQDVNKAIQVPWESTLTYAVHYRNYNAVRYLLENGHFAVDEPDPNGNTALIIAAKYNRLDIAKLLLDLGASKSCADDTGKTAYDHAVEKGYAEMAELLSND